jgi:hypothetical protein
MRLIDNKAILHTLNYRLEGKSYGLGHFQPLSHFLRCSRYVKDFMW